ncbi:hypothetical protein [Archangium lansingense]|uniref:Uncharacterized protein n=1 Tax=Archangium lansingense TaxID=2995310 RepID=A0ABT4AJ21_9BACT|nr:hypothetical protein [Archangium lansinium]MCY1081665.1 hypothetical protein [Archangium lansinium]
MKYPSTYDLYDTQEAIGKQWVEHPSPEQRRLLGLARDALRFVYATGQPYRFEEFRLGLESGARPPPGTVKQSRNDFASLEEELSSTRAFLTKLRDGAESARDKEVLQVIVDTLHFISVTAQHGAFSAYLEHLEADAPPYAIASFDTKEAAEAWLKNQPIPPDSADVLIADTYHYVIHDERRGVTRLPRTRILEYHLADLKQRNPPVAVASFATLEEAEAWLKALPEPARWAWVSIAGEPYLAVYHPNIQHRALYPLSMSNGYEIEDEEEEEPNET